jgi:hypothetical protein
MIPETQTFRRATRRQTKLKLGMTGPSGSGKTTSALRLGRGLVGPQGKIAVIDTENGSASLYSDRYDFDVLEISPPFEHPKFIDAIHAAASAGYDCVILDSASHFWEGLLEFKDKLDRRGGNSFTNWNEATRHFKDILNAVLQSPIHVICCLRSKIDYVIEQDGKGKAAPRKIGLAPIMRDGVEYEFTTVFDVDLNHQAATSKDRTGLFADRIFQITEDTGAQLARWLEIAEPAPAAPAVSLPSAAGLIITREQLEKLDLYWATLKKTAADKTKAFEWLGCDEAPGEEHWANLSAAQAERLIALLQKKMNELGSATSAQVAAAGKAVLA